MIRRLLIWLLKPLVKDQDVRDVMVDLGDYNKMDCYRDFVKTFSTPHGQRVMTQILVWGGISKGHFIKGIGTEQMFFKEGQRNLALKIMAATSAVPVVDKPTERRKNR